MCLCVYECVKAWVCMCMSVHVCTPYLIEAQTEKKNRGHLKFSESWHCTKDLGMGASSFSQACKVLPGPQRGPYQTEGYGQRGSQYETAGKFFPEYKKHYSQNRVTRNPRTSLESGILNPMCPPLVQTVPHLHLIWDPGCPVSSAGLLGTRAGVSNQQQE